MCNESDASITVSGPTGRVDSIQYRVSQLPSLLTLRHSDALVIQTYLKAQACILRTDLLGRAFQRMTSLFPIRPGNQQTFFTPVELKSLAQRERQRHKGSQGFSLLAAPRAEGGQLAVAAVVALGFDLFEESLGGSAVVFCPKRIGFACLFQRFVEMTVHLAIWCSDSMSRKYIRRIFPIISMLITLCSPSRKVSRSS